MRLWKQIGSLHSVFRVGANRRRINDDDDGRWIRHRIVFGVRRRIWRWACLLQSRCTSSTTIGCMRMQFESTNECLTGNEHRNGAGKTAHALSKGKGGDALNTCPMAEERMRRITKKCSECKKKKRGEESKESGKPQGWNEKEMYLARRSSEKKMIRRRRKATKAKKKR